LAVISRLFWVQRTKAFVSNEITPWKLKLLRLFWVSPIVNKEPICPDPRDKTSGIYKTIELWKQNWWYNPGQYHNENNPNAHYEITWPQIYDQLDWDIQIFCAWLWTTGTMTGISKFLQEKDKNIVSLWVIRKPNNPIPWPRTKSLLSQISFNWNDFVNETIEIGTKESYVKSLEMIRYGLVVWPSSWFALAWILEFIKKKKKTLDMYRNSMWEINIVFICCDSPFPYIDEYFIYVDQKYFPEIENNELLLNKGDTQKLKVTKKESNYQLQSMELFNMIFYWNKEAIESKIEAWEEIEINKEWILYDIRTQEEFSHFHIPWSQNIQENDIVARVSYMKNKKIVVICRYWIKSLDVVNILRNQGIDAYSFLGWVTERSDNLLPRWKPSICFKK
jgi:cysteine synthase/rhodanese-related sulfurtransferase